MKALNRIKHSQPGFIRRMQMSRCRLWIMVEGLFDRTFYGRICEANKYMKKCSYKICLPRDLPDLTGYGKNILLQMYQYLSKHRKLTSEFGGEKTSVLFFLDKDVDDLTHHKIKSKYAIYTEYYSADNYAFRFGDLCTALSSWSSLDLRSIKRQIGTDSIQWTKIAANNWKAWVEHCILVTFLGIRVPSFSTDSMMHNGPYGNINAQKQIRLSKLIMEKSGLTREQLLLNQKKAAKLVENIFRKGEHDKIFNGKWYRKFLAEDARRSANQRQYSARASETLLTQYLLLTLDYSSGWAEHFHHAINQAFLRLQ